jgi:hypothetical protein
MDNKIKRGWLAQRLAIFAGLFVISLASMTYGMENLLSPQLQAQGELLFREALEVIPDLTSKPSWQEAAQALIKCFSPTDPLEIAQFWVNALEEGPNLSNNKCTEDEHEVWFTLIKMLLMHTKQHINMFWWGKNALSCALKKENEELVELLLGHGAQVNGSSRENFIPLHEAALKGNARLVTMLILYGAKVNKLDKNGRTILNKLLVRYKKAPNLRMYNVIKLLLKAGARVHVANRIDYTRLSKYLGFEVTSLPNKLPIGLSKEKLASLCLISENYFNLVKEAVHQADTLEEDGDLREFAYCGLDMEQLGKWISAISLMKVVGYIQSEDFL